MIIIIKSSLPDPRHPSRGIFSLKLAYYLSKYEDVLIYYTAFQGNSTYALSLLPSVDKNPLTIKAFLYFPGFNRLRYIRNLVWSIQLYLTIQKLAPDEKVCILSYFFLPGASLFENLKKILKNIRTVIHYSESNRIQDIAFLRNLNTLSILKNTDLVISNNPDYKISLLKLIGESESECQVNIKYVPSGYDTRAVEQALLTAKNIGVLRNSRYSELKISSIGTITPRKGQQSIINALARLDSELRSDDQSIYRKICLNLVGPLELPLDIPPLDNVQVNLLGSLSHEHCLLEMIDSDLVCQPSSSEGMSNAVVEAIALRKPIIMSDIPSNRYLASPSSQSLVKSSCNTQQLFTLFKSISTGQIGLNSLIVDPINILTLSERAHQIYHLISQ